MNNTQIAYQQKERKYDTGIGVNSSEDNSFLNLYLL